MAPLIQILRPDDLVSLIIEPRNLKLDTSNPAAPRLLLEDSKKPSYLLIHFAPQHILEKAYFEVAANVKTNPGFNGPTAPPPPGTTDPLDPPGSVPTRLSGGSSLVFKLPHGLKSIPYTTQALLDWSKFELVVSPTALGKAGPPPLTPPTDLETAIELPYGLYLSPGKDVGWLHSTKPEVFKGRVALWHTRLGRWVEVNKGGKKVRSLEEASDQNHIPFRAIWCEDFVDHGIIPPLGTEQPFRASISPHDRPQLVILTSGASGYFVPSVTGQETPWVPQPAKASRLFLSTLGGYLTSRGSWPSPPSYTPNVDEGIQSLDLTEWAHVATLGRDHYVRIVYEGFLYPFGHRASLVKVTERKVVPPGTDPAVTIATAYLRQHMYIVVREHEKNYDAAPYQFARREMPFWKSVHINTQVTPDIDLPVMITGDGNPHDSFWVQVGGAGFDFNITAKDLAGQRVDFLAKLIFMSNAENFPGFVKSTYASSGNQRTCVVQGQKIAYAPPAAGDTTLKTNKLFFDTQLLQTSGPYPIVPFLPSLDHAAVSVPALEQILGTNTPVDIGLYAGYLNGGLDPHAGVYAQVLGTPTPIAFTADKSGGLATPKLALTALSAKKGLVSGNPDDAAVGKIKPSEFFGDVSAQLFGTIPLQQLIPVNAMLADAAKNAPEIRTLKLPPRVKPPQTIVTKLEWHPELQKYDNPPVKLEFDNKGKSALSLKVRLARSLVGAPPTSEATGELSHFMLTLADVVAVQINLLKFKSINGAKSTVEAKLESSNPVGFIGPLSFVQTLADILPSSIFGGSGVKIELKPSFIRATLTIGLPTIAVGVFSLEHISFMAGIDLPYLDGKPAFEFAFASRSKPFLLTIEIFGGGGFVHLVLDTDGVQMVEGALEFGGNFAFDVGVASGGVHVMAGIYFQMKKTGSTITGFVDIGGEVSILGIISISIDLNLSLSYNTANHKVTGRATLTVSIHIIFFSISASISVEKSFGSSGGDPRMSDLMTQSDWAQYAAAFA